MYYEKLDRWLELEATAKEDALDEPAVMELLASWRAGEPSAKSAIIKGILHRAFTPAFDWVERKGTRRFDDVIDKLYVGIAKVIDRMLKNDRDDLIDLIDDQIRRVTKSVFREDDSTIRVPWATKSSRKKKGKEPYFNLKRVGGCITNAALADAESDDGDAEDFYASPDYKGPLTTQSGKRVRLASKYRGFDEGLETADLLHNFPEEDRAVVAMLIENIPLGRIAKETSMSLYRVRKVKTQLQKFYGGTAGVFDAVVEQAVKTDGNSDGCCGLANSESMFVEPNGLELAVSA